MKLRIRKLMYEEIGGARADYLFSMFARLCEGLAETLYMVLWAQRILYGGTMMSIVADTGYPVKKREKFHLRHFLTHKKL